jgi:hypothetical protein
VFCRTQLERHVTYEDSKADQIQRLQATNTNNNDKTAESSLGQKNTEKVAAGD